MTHGKCDETENDIGWLGIGRCTIFGIFFHWQCEGDDEGIK